ncbi:thioredoxin family protein [Lacinutrix salivirga]
MKLKVLIFLFMSLQYGVAQTSNQEVIDDKGKAKLLGVINKEGLKKPAYAEWFNKNYNDYAVNKTIVKQLKASLNHYTIKVFLGTWCGDSKLEVPRFYNVLETAKFPTNQLEVIALDNTEDAYKQGPNGEEKGMNIHRVPTFILYKNGKEVNRIVEHPKETLERDLLKIVTNKRYTPNYVAANYLQNELETKALDTLKKETTFLVSMLSEYTKGSRELNTLGYVYLRAKQYEKALFVFKLNALIFPYKYTVYDSLAEAYFVIENYTEALKTYYKVLSLQPDDNNALDMVKKITELQRKAKEL